MVVREYKKLEYSRILFMPIRLIGRYLGSSSNGWCSPSIGNHVGIRDYHFPRRCAMRLHFFSFVANRVGTCTRDRTCLVLRGGSFAKAVHIRKISTSNFLLTITYWKAWRQPARIARAIPRTPFHWSVGCNISGNEFLKNERYNWT